MLLGALLGSRLEQRQRPKYLLSSPPTTFPWTVAVADDVHLADTAGLSGVRQRKPAPPAQQSTSAIILSQLAHSQLTASPAAAAAAAGEQE